MSSRSETKPKKRLFGRKPKDPNKPGNVKQFFQVVQMTHRQDPKMVWWVAAAFFGVLAISLVIGFIWGHPLYLAFIGVMLGLLAGMFILGRRAERAAYLSLQGQTGGSLAVLGQMRGAWTYEEEPVAADMGRARSVRDMSKAAMVFRAVGKPGVVLIGEGPAAARDRKLREEAKRVTRVVGPEVPVHTISVGEGKKDISLGELVKAMKKLPKALNKNEIAAVGNRLRALGGARPGIPAGVDPTRTRINRSAMRG